jgi:hypothetical protein
MSTLTPGKRYFVKVGGTTVYSPIADYAGVIQFSHSNWPAGVFTVVEDASAASIGNISVTSRYVNNTLLAGASVALYTQGGMLYDSFKITPANGTVQFKNVPAGSYSVNLTKGRLYGSNTSVVTVTDQASINLNMALMYYDLNGDGKINVLDPSAIMAHYGTPGRPVYDVNGDGMVDTEDIDVFSDLTFDQ